MAIKWVLAVIVIAALDWFLLWSGWLTNKQANPMLGNQNATSTQETAPINGMSASNDASDEAISQDTAAIDAQLSAYTTDTTDVDSSMNDKQISQ